MTPEERADELLRITPESLDKFLKDHVEIVRTLHTWFLARAEELDVVAINHMKHFFGQFVTQTALMIQQEMKLLNNDIKWQ